MKGYAVGVACSRDSIYGKCLRNLAGKPEEAASST
jgi:hypothetical protein